MHFNLFTTCTSSGNAPAIPALNGKDLNPFNSHTEMAEYWKDTIQSIPEEKKHLAANLYSGVSYRAAQRIKTTLESEGHTVHLYIVSIGYGLIDPEEMILPYNLSLIYDESEGSASMWRLIQNERFNPELWWNLVNKLHDKKNNPITEVISRDENSINLVCISATFLSMVAGDIYKATQDSKATVIVLGPSNTTQYVKAPKRLLVNGNIFPISRDKLALKVPGNKFDQPQRAGIYLVEKWLETKSETMIPEDLIGDIAYSNTQKSQPAANIGLTQAVEELRAAGLTFDAAHQKLLNTGHIISSKALKILWDPEESKKIEEANDSNAAIKALQNIGLVTPENEEEATELLLVFKKAIVDGGFVGNLFGAKEIFLWAKNYCEATNRDIPGKFESPQKLTHFVKQVGPSMNIFVTDNPKVQTSSFRVVD